MNERSTDFYVLDTETDEWDLSKMQFQRKTYKYQILKRKLIIVRKYDYNAKILHTIRIIESKIENLFTQIEQNAIIYAHNLDFDFKFVIDELIDIYHSDCKIIKNNRIISVSVNSDKAKFQLIDSFSILPYSVKNLGIMLKFFKKDVDYKESAENMIEYCERDCDIVANALVKFRDLITEFDNTIDKTKPFFIKNTTASNAISLFLNQNKKYEYEKENSKGQIITKNRLFDISEELNDYIRTFYYGGRVEVFDCSILPDQSYFDINSLYTSTMRYVKLPLPPYQRVKITHPNQLSNKCCLLLCEIDESSQSIPIFPQRINQKVFYASCKKVHLLTIDEYNYALAQDLKITVKEAILCSEFDFLFNYFDTIFAKRLQMQIEANPAENLCKLLPNCSYGKFAQRKEKSETKIMSNALISKEDYIKLVLEYDIDVKDNFSYLTKNVNCKVPFQNLVFAIYITGNSRLKLTRKIRYLDEYNQIYQYCDTDSLVANNPSFFELSKNLGSFKKEIEADWFFAFGQKEYVFYAKDKKDKQMKVNSKIKGVKRDSDIEAYFTNGVEIARPTKISESVKRNLPFTSAISVLKQKESFYNRRIFTKNCASIPLTNLTENYINSVEIANRSILLAQIEELKKLIKK